MVFLHLFFIRLIRGESGSSAAKGSLLSQDAKLVVYVSNGRFTSQKAIFAYDYRMRHAYAMPISSCLQHESRHVNQSYNFLTTVASNTKNVVEFLNPTTKIKTNAKRSLKLSNVLFLLAIT